MNQLPGHQIQFPRIAHYSGYNINATAGSRTVRNADLRRGDVLQFDPFNHERVAASASYTGSYGSPSVSDTLNLGMDYVVSVSTASFNTPLGVVVETPDTAINDLDPLVSNKRRGGIVRVATTGLVQARVRLGVATGSQSTVKGQTRLSLKAGEVAFQLFNTSATVDTSNLVCGAASGTPEVVAARVHAIAMESVTDAGSASGTEYLMWVQLIQPLH